VAAAYLCIRHDDPRRNHAADRITPILIGAAICRPDLLASEGGDPNWITGPQKSFNIKSLKIDDVLGTVKIDVRDGGQATLQINGLKQRVDGISVKEANGTLLDQGPRRAIGVGLEQWFDFSYNDIKPDQLFVLLTIPKGTRVDVDDVIGRATIGNTEGVMNSLLRRQHAIDDRQCLRGAHSLAGSGKINVGNVAGALSAEPPAAATSRSVMHPRWTPTSPGRVRSKSGASSGP